MATLTELTVEIVSAHASGSSLTSEELIRNILTVYNTLKALEAGDSIAAEESPAVETPTITIKQAFKKDEIICMVCGRGGMKTLKRHLQVAHDMKPNQYKKQFNIPSSMTLVAKNYSEQRKKDALERGQGDVLAKARAAKKAVEKEAEQLVEITKAVPVTKGKAQLEAGAIQVIKDDAPVKAKGKVTPVKVEIVPVKVKKAPPVKLVTKANK